MPSKKPLPKILGKMRLLEVVEDSKYGSNFQVTLECLVCRTRKTCWSSNYRQGSASCLVCKQANSGTLKAPGLGQRRPYAVVSPAGITLSWGKEAPALEEGQVLFKAVNSNTFSLCTEGLDTLSPMPAIASTYAPPSDTPVPPPQTIYPLHIVIPRHYLGYYIGTDSTNEQAAEALLETLVDFNPASEVTAGETSSWLKDGEEYVYLYFKDNLSCIKTETPLGV